MIFISNGDPAQVDRLMLSGMEREMLQHMKHSPVEYRFQTPEALEFELKMRSRIVDAAKALNASRISFATFKDSHGNDKLWLRMPNGGLRLREGVSPSEGILDIFQNGSRYAFECATAMTVVLYKATLDMIGKDAFNRHFRDLLLYDWNLDNDMRLIGKNHVSEALPGDIQYFKNPDHDPKKPQWQGENVILLDRNLYYGHGIGIKNGEQMIAALNTKRRSGSTIPAFLSELVAHPDFEHLRELPARLEPTVRPDRLEVPVFAKIGTSVYLYRELPGLEAVGGYIL